MRLFLICLLLISGVSFAKETPYQLSSKDPLKKNIDKIFSKSRHPLKDLAHLKKIGFDSLKREKRTHIIVTTHPKIPGYIFKIYTEDQNIYRQGIKKLISRIKGINKIRKYIVKHKKQDIFKVPYKWLYKIKGENQFILVEEKMDIDPMHFAKWKNPLFMTKELLNEVYALTTSVGYNDGLSPDNLPFCLDGKISIIDSERVGKLPVRYGSLTKYLPSNLQSHWTHLYTK